MTTHAAAAMAGRKRGAALITVMLVISLIAVIAMGLLSRQRLDIERTRNMQEDSQLYQYALGAEELARQLIAQQVTLTPDIAYTGQQWASPQGGIDVERGTLSYAVEDLQGRFNINTLAGGNVAAANHFTQLATLLGLKQEMASAIIARVNSQTSPLDNITVLRTTPGLGADEYAVLAPYIAALPDLDTALNVNTASDTLLRAYVTNQSVYERLITLRSKQGFISEQQLRAIGMNTTGMSVKSRYFIMTAEAGHDGHAVTLRSLLHAETDAKGNTGLRVISRDTSRVF